MCIELDRWPQRNVYEIQNKPRMLLYCWGEKMWGRQGGIIFHMAKYHFTFWGFAKLQLSLLPLPTTRSIPTNHNHSWAGHWYIMTQLSYHTYTSFDTTTLLVLCRLHISPITGWTLSDSCTGISGKQSTKVPILFYTTIISCTNLLSGIGKTCYLYNCASNRTHWPCSRPVMHYFETIGGRLTPDQLLAYRETHDIDFCL